MRRITDEIELNNNLLNICNQIVEACRVPVNKQKFKIWSPEIAGYYIVLKALRRSLGKPSLLDKYAKTANKDMLKIGKDGETIWNNMKLLLELQTPRRNSIEGRIKEVKKHLTYKELKKKREIFVECLIRRNNPKFLFKELKPKTYSIDLTFLSHSGIRYTDPKEIHEIIVNAQKEIFGKHIHDGKEFNWTNDDFDFEGNLFNPIIPREMLKKLETAFYSTQEKRKLVELSLEDIKHGPTFLDFYKEIMRSNKKSAGGPSGLTYHMLQNQSIKILEHIFILLQLNWQSNSSPEWLQRKLLSLVPKKSNESSLSNIRPIVLVEVLRKIWAGAIIKAIRNAWEKFEILQPTQYGFRQSRSCASCLIQFINLSESARELNQEMYFSSWDFKDAFPSIPRYIIYISLRRLGVPHQLATYFGELDLGESILPCTPYALLEDSDPSTFCTYRGLPQGDRASPSIWDGVMDFPLTLSANIASNLPFLGSPGKIHFAHDTSFADDMLSYANTPTILQEKATVTSAATIILGLKFALPKLRTGIANARKSTNKGIYVYDNQWNPILIPFNTKGFIKYLGSKQGLNGISCNEIHSLEKNYLLKSPSSWQN